MYRRYRVLYGKSQSLFSKTRKDGKPSRVHHIRKHHGVATYIVGSLDFLLVMGSIVVTQIIGMIARTAPYQYATVSKQFGVLDLVRSGDGIVQSTSSDCPSQAVGRCPFRTRTWYNSRSRAAGTRPCSATRRRSDRTVVPECGWGRWLGCR